MVSRRSRFLTLLVLIGVVSLVGAGATYAQSGTDGGGEPASLPVATEGTPDTPESSSAADDPLADARRRDLLTATYYDLLSRAEALGLDTSGSRDRLLERVAAELGIDLGDDPAASTSDGEPGASRLTIEAADQTRYFTIDETSERYLRLTGGVRLRIEDPQRDGVHIITADEVVFNEDEASFTAQGNAEYVMRRESGDEVFRGDSLTFNIDTWEGVFIEGVTERSRTIDSRDLLFRFSGSAATRSTDDVVVLEDGSITSSLGEPPYYSLDARRIWILGPGEWAVQGAVLRVGAVPLVYLPVFAYPADEMVIHPSFGHSPRTGNYVQTTTYLVGEKAKSDTPLSIFQLSEEPGEEYETERRGLFLARSRGEGEPEDGAPSAVQLLKVLFDVYANIGAYAAVEGRLAPQGSVVQQTTLYGALAVSRDVYRNGGLYAPRYVDEAGRAAMHLNRGYFFGIELPFRFGINAAVALQIRRLNLNAAVQVYSDPSFMRDFGGRSEDLNWLGSLGITDEDGASGSSVSSTTWEVRAGWSADTSALRPFVSALALSNLTVSLAWASRTVPTSEQSYAVRVADASPNVSYYAPSSLTLPSLRARVAGSPLDVTLGSLSRYPDRGADPVVDLRPPWETREDGDDPDAPDGGYRLPGRRGDRSGAVQEDSSRASVSYSVQPSLSLTAGMNDSTWQLPTDVGIDPAYWELTGGVATSLDGRVTVLGNLGTFSLSVPTRLQGRHVFGFNSDVADTRAQAVREQAFRYSSATVDASATLRLLPLRAIPALADSSLSYQLRTRLVERSLDSIVDGVPTFTSPTIGWNTETIRGHQASWSTAVSTAIGGQTLSVTGILPPGPVGIDLSLVSALGPLSNRVQWGIDIPEAEAEDGQRVEIGTLSFGQTLALPLGWSISQTSVVDVEERVLSSLNVSASLSPVSASASFSHGTGLRFQDVDVGFVADEVERLRLRSIVVSAPLSYAPEPLWKDRISVSVNASPRISIDAQRFSNAELTFGLRTTLSIHEFLTLSFSSDSYNRRLYRYWPTTANLVGIDRDSFLVDLLRSFNFFNIQDRYRSSFKVRSISCSVEHDLRDWLLSAAYVGRPALETDPETGRRRYEWDSSFDVAIAWRPIPEIEYEESFPLDDEE